MYDPERHRQAIEHICASLFTAGGGLGLCATLMQWLDDISFVLEFALKLGNFVLITLGIGWYLYKFWRIWKARNK